LDQLLRERLAILKATGMISDEIGDSIIEFAKGFEEKYSLELTEENASMLITHLVMALARIQRGEEVNPMDELAMEEISHSEFYIELPEIYMPLEDKLRIRLPDSEKGYIALHACTIVAKMKGGSRKRSD